MAAIDSLPAADVLAEIATVPLAASSTWFRRLVEPVIRDGVPVAARRYPAKNR
jgi:hypothetical protein